MEESSSSEAIASVRETTPFVRDKQRTREMNYICAIGSRIMKMIDRYLFDIGKFTCHTLLTDTDLKQRNQRLSATGVQRGTEIFTYPNQLAINGVNYRNGAIQAHAPGCIKNIDVYFTRIRAGFSPLTCIIKNIDLS